MQGLTFTIKQRKHWFFDAFVLRFHYYFALYATLATVACCTVCFATSVVVDKLGNVCPATFVWLLVRQLTNLEVIV